VFGLVLGAKYLVEAVVALAGIFDVSPGLISITVVALGTSLPELTVSLKAIKEGKTEMAVGNIFGSNAFNILMAVGIPGLFSTLMLDAQTFKVGVPVLAVASFIFLVFGISKRIYRWGGMMFIVFYIFFILKLLGL
jgi:cation:H+ antiporter